MQIVPWIDPTSPDITTASNAFAAAIPQIVPFLSTPNVRFTPIQQHNVDVAFWTLGSETLLMAVNPNQANASLVLEGVTGGTAREVLNGGAELAALPGQGGVVLTLEPTGTSAWIFEQRSSDAIKGTVTVGSSGSS